jgi:DNA-binding MarR family transcriptional regulator
VVADLDDRQYQQLLEFRTQLRRFLRWSEDEARAVGLSPAQHQLLLAIRGSRAAAGPTIREVADALLLRHHSAVELVDRAAAEQLVERRPDPHDQRAVRLVLTRKGADRLRRLSRLHLDELTRLSAALGVLGDGAGERESRRRS